MPCWSTAAGAAIATTDRFVIARVPAAGFGAASTSWNASSGGAAFFRQAVSNDNAEAWIATSTGIFYVSGVGATPVSLSSSAAFDLNLDPTGHLWSVTAGVAQATDGSTAFPTSAVTVTTLVGATSATGVWAQNSSWVWGTGYSTGAFK